MIGAETGKTPGLNGASQHSTNPITDKDKPSLLDIFTAFSSFFCCFAHTPENTTVVFFQ